MLALEITSAEWSKFKLMGSRLINVDDLILAQLRRVILLLHETIPIDRITVDAQALPFVYTIKFVDGREWIHKAYDYTSAPPCSLEVTGQWMHSNLGSMEVIMNTAQTVIRDGDIVDFDMRPR